MKEISELNFGFRDAENYSSKANRDLFNRIFVKNRFLEKILLPSTYYIVGEKGTGKTAYSVFLSNNEYKQTRSEIRFIREIEYQKFAKIKKMNSLNLSEYEDIWKVCIYTLVAGIIKESDIKANIFVKGHKLRRLREAVESYYNNAFSPEIVQVLNWLENSKMAAKVVFDHLKAGAELTNQVSYKESTFQVNLLYLRKQFEEALGAIKLQKNLILFIDGIDLRPESIDYQDYIEVIKGLANAAWSVNKDFFGQIKDSKPVKIVLLLRPDIFNHLRLQNQANKITDNSAYLDWRTTYADYRGSPLFQVADNIFACQQESKPAEGTSWFHYLPWQRDAFDELKGKEDSFVDVLRLSYSRPRDIQVILEMLQEVAIERGESHSDSFLEATYRGHQFRAKFSNYLLSSLRDALLFYYTEKDYEYFLHFFHYLGGSASFTYSEYSQFFAKFKQIENIDESRCPDFMKNELDFLQFLYDNNVICYIEKSDYETFFSWCYRERSPSNINPRVKPDLQYKIHYGLHKALNVGTKTVI